MFFFKFGSRSQSKATQANSYVHSLRICQGLQRQAMSSSYSAPAFFTEGLDLSGALRHLRNDPFRPLLLVMDASNRDIGESPYEALKELPDQPDGSLGLLRRVLVPSGRGVAWFRAHFKIRSLRGTAIMTCDGWSDVQEGAADILDLEARANKALRLLGERAVVGLALAKLLEAHSVPNGRRVSAAAWLREPRYADLPNGPTVIRGGRAPLLRLRSVASNLRSSTNSEIESDTKNEVESDSENAAQNNIDTRDTYRFAVSSVEVTVRLPGGDRVSGEFGPRSRLGEVKDLVTRGGNMKQGFRLATAFPRRVFTQAEMRSSLRELDLAQNCLLVAEVVQNDQITTQHNILVAWILALWAFLVSLFAGKQAGSNLDQEEQPQQQQRQPQAEGAKSNVRTMQSLRENSSIDTSTSKDQKGPNEYFGGDSTVFQGGGPSDQQ